MFRSKRPLGITEIAFNRLESLWDSWCESRYANRILITNSIILNIQLIMDYGSQEDLDMLIEYTSEFEEKLKESLASHFHWFKKAPSFPSGYQLELNLLTWAC